MYYCRLKFIYSEKATNFCKISNVDLSYVVRVKSIMEILQNFVAFSEYMNFKLHRTPVGTILLPIQIFYIFVWY